MDSFYGLKEAHDIDEFMKYFAQTDLMEGLLSKSPEEADRAVWQLVNIWLDDGHSNFYMRSYLSEKNPSEDESGFSRSGSKALAAYLKALY